MKIISAAPVRISFGGGGTDVSPFTEEYGGAVLSTSISRYNYTILKPAHQWILYDLKSDYKEIFGSIQEMKYTGKLDLIKAVVKYFMPKQKFQISIYSEVSHQSGLGGSASAFVSCIGAFNYLLKDKRLDPYEISELAYSLERKELKVAGGRQDQYASVFGGLNFIEFKGEDWVKMIPLRISESTLFELEKNLVLIYLGKRRVSGDILKEQIKNVEKGINVEALLKNKEIAYEMKRALIRQDLESFGRLLDLSWKYKKQYSNMITNTYIEDVYNFVKDNGAIGAKLTGAGGGGHMIIYAPEEKAFRLKEKLKQKNIEVVDFKFENYGLRTWEVIDENDIKTQFGRI